MYFTDRCSWGCSTNTFFINQVSKSVTDPLWKYFQNTFTPSFFQYFHCFSQSQWVIVNITSPWTCQQTHVTLSRIWCHFYFVWPILCNSGFILRSKNIYQNPHLKAKISQPENNIEFLQKEIQKVAQINVLEIVAIVLSTQNVASNQNMM